MSALIKKSMRLTFAAISVIFTFVPESFFANYEWISQDDLAQYKCFSNVKSQDANIIISRIICFILAFVILSVVYWIFLKIRSYVIIKGQNYLIKVEYGDILKTKKCKRVISFDECFTTKVGEATADVNPNSICGQYLLTHPDLNIQQLIELYNIKPARAKSKYQQKTRYASGTIIPNGDDLLMAFVPLDERGKGRFFSRDEYLSCLDNMWNELENHYAEKDVCIPILGAGTTCFDGGNGLQFLSRIC